MASKVAMVLGTVVVFTITVVIMLRVMPGPHKSTDYLVIGAFATFLCLLVLWVGVLITSGRTDTFYKRRKTERP